MEQRLDIVGVRLAHLRATTAQDKAWYHVAVQNFLICFAAASDAGDHRAATFFAARLAHCYRAMGLEEKARGYEILA